MSESYFNKKLEPIQVKEKSVSQLLAEMSRTAYQGRKLGEAVDVWENMLKEKDLTIVMGLSGSMSTAGQWTIINWLIEKRFIDVLVSTGANVSEDIVDAMGLGYWQGSQIVDDEALLKADVNRYYDVYGKETDYRKMEELVNKLRFNIEEGFPVFFNRVFAPARQIPQQERREKHCCGCGGKWSSNIQSGNDRQRLWRSVSDGEKPRSPRSIGFGQRV